jgi:uncharacterized protein YqeY
MRERIAAALKDAMKSQDQTRISTLRLIMATLKDREIAQRADGEESPVEDDAAVLAILSKMVRQREESIKAYEEGGRLELAAREQAEIAVIRDFLPRPMSPDEVEAAVRSAIADTEADGIKDMGRVIGALKARHPGRMDFGQVSQKVRQALC